MYRILLLSVIQILLINSIGFSSDYYYKNISFGKGTKILTEGQIPNDRANSYTCYHFKYDENNNLILVEYLNYGMLKRSKTLDAASLQMTYSDEGTITRTYLSTKGLPEYKQVWDNRDNLIRVEYYNKAGKLAKNNKGVAIGTVEYDSTNNISCIMFFDENNRFINNKDYGYAIAKDRSKGNDNLEICHALTAEDTLSLELAGNLDSIPKNIGCIRIGMSNDDVSNAFKSGNDNLLIMNYYDNDNTISGQYYLGACNTNFPINFERTICTYYGMDSFTHRLNASKNGVSVDNQVYLKAIVLKNNQYASKEKAIDDYETLKTFVLSKLEKNGYSIISEDCSNKSNSACIKMLKLRITAIIGNRMPHEKPFVTIGVGRNETNPKMYNITFIYDNGVKSIKKEISSIFFP